MNTIEKYIQTQSDNDFQELLKEINIVEKTGNFSMYKKITALTKNARQTFDWADNTYIVKLLKNEACRRLYLFYKQN